MLGAISRKNRELFYPKEKVISYNQEVNSNKYARELRPLSKRFFGVIDVDGSEFMDKCYVNQRDYAHAFRNFRTIINDSITPYLKEYGVKDFTDDNDGGDLGNRIVRNLGSQIKGEVIVLFGGKGSGKSTFLKKLLYHKPPQLLSDNSIISIVDLLNTPEDETIIHNRIWQKIVSNLDVNDLLSGDRSTLSELFSDRLMIAKKQILCGLDEDSETYNVKLNELIKEFISDKKYVAGRLIDYWAKRQKGCVIVVDNTDQYPHSVQDFCFTISQEISNELGCLVIISMREERFHASRMHGTLDAYQNAGFHISSPVIQSVFAKRISYVLSILNSPEEVREMFGDSFSEDTRKACIKLFKIFENEFSARYDSPIRDFLTACAHGNIRLALELFRDLLKSGYINVDEMISVDDIWVLKIHQVLKPLMIPYRLFYEEDQSSIPNIFKARSTANGSHFTGLRILKKLSDGIDPSNPFFVSIGELKKYFYDNFNMIDDFEKNIDLFLKRDLVEANNRIDYYCDEVDSVKVTTYGLYILQVLSSYFTYIELVSVDCGFFCERTAGEMVSLSNQEYKHFTKRRSVERVNVRLNKAETFIKYLIDEEEKENKFFGLSPCQIFPFELWTSSHLKKTQYLEVSIGKNINVCGKLRKCDDAYSLLLLAIEQILLTR